MPNGRIHSIETMGLVDGPGIRTVLFFQGCPLRCSYCHNPDTWEFQSGKEMEVQEIIKKLKRFLPYYGESGGVTCSGGEPLMQMEFLIELFKACKKEGIHTCLDTSGYGKGEYEELLAVTDLVLFDVKHYEKAEYHKITGGDISVPEKFLQAVIKSKTPLWIRHVVVPGITDSIEHMEGLREYLKKIPLVEKVELLPYHVLGLGKYENMEIPYPLSGTEPMDKETLKELQKIVDNR